MSLPGQSTHQAPALSQQARAELLALVESSRAVYATASGDASNIVAALEVADTIAGLRAYFDRPEIQKRILSLMDTPLGFRTDRPPGAKNRKTGEALPPYPWAVVREASLEGLLRGLQLVGNQINIIAGRMYCTREGFDALIRKDPAVSDFVPLVGVPANKPGGVVVPCSASWKQSGVSRAFAADIPVRTDEGSGVDAIIGKATRKFLKRCFEMMSGQVLPEGDSGEVHPEGEAPKLGRPQGPARTADPRALPPTQAPGAVNATGTHPPKPAAAGTPPPGTQGAAASATPPAAAANPTAAEPAPEPGVLQNRLAAEVASWGFGKFDQFRAVAIKTGILAGAEEDAGSYLDLSNNTAKKFLSALGSLRKAMESEYGVPAQDGGQEGGAQ